MDESEHGGDKRFLPQFKDERLAARFAFAMAAVVFDELYCMVGALGFVGITWPSLASTVKRAAGRSERQQLFTAQHLQHFIRQHAEIAGGIAPTTVQRQRLARVVSVFDFLCAFADNRAQ